MTGSPPSASQAAETSTPEPRTLTDVLAETAGRLRRAGIEDPRRDARLLVGLATGLAAETMLGHPDRPLDAAARPRLAALVARRCAGEPISRIAGFREFWSLPFHLSPDTLDPRPDSETLVEAVLDAVGDRNRRIRLLDLGTGTGCLLLALLSELPNATGLGVDLSEGACRTARDNARRLGLAGRSSFLAGDWTAALTGPFDVVVANPPYIPDAVVDTLAPAVARFDPRRALAGGADGLEAYRRIVAPLADLLAVGGIAAFEVGEGQAAALAAMLAGNGLAVQDIRRDLAGVERCVLACRRPAAGPGKS